MRFDGAAILGSGSFGTAIAKLLSPKLERIVLIGRDAGVAEGINRAHRNPQYLTDIVLPANITAGTDVSAAVGYPLLIFAVPTAATRNCAEEIARGGLQSGKFTDRECASWRGMGTSRSARTSSARTVLRAKRRLDRRRNNQ